MTSPRRWPWAAHAEQLRLGTRIVIRDSGVAMVKVADNTWRSEHHPKAEPQTDSQAGWWIEHRPEKTVVDESHAGPQVEPVQL